MVCLQTSRRRLHLGRRTHHRDNRRGYLSGFYPRRLPTVPVAFDVRLASRFAGGHLRNWLAASGLSSLVALLKAADFVAATGV
jgi:hypothetical protein